MVWDVSFNCDICGKKKGESNHWWMLVVAETTHSEERQPSHRFTLFPWEEDESRDSEMYHLCGQGCAMQALERFMTDGTITTTSDAGEPSI